MDLSIYIEIVNNSLKFKNLNEIAISNPTFNKISRGNSQLINFVGLSGRKIRSADIRVDGRSGGAGERGGRGRSGDRQNAFFEKT